MSVYPQVREYCTKKSRWEVKTPVDTEKTAMEGAKLPELKPKKARGSRRGGYNFLIPRCPSSRRNIPSRELGYDTPTNLPGHFPPFHRKKIRKYGLTIYMVKNLSTREKCQHCVFLVLFPGSCVSVWWELWEPSPGSIPPTTMKE